MPGCLPRALTLRQRRRWRCCALAAIAVALTAVVLIDQLILAGRAGPRLLSRWLLTAGCATAVPAAANLSLLSDVAYRGELDAIFADNAAVEQRFRKRDGHATVLFVHFHKAGGTSLCGAARTNGERTAITAGSSQIMSENTLNCNLCWKHWQPWMLHDQQSSFLRAQCPFPDLTLTDTAAVQRAAFQRTTAERDGPQLSFIAIETPARTLSPDFIAGADRPWVYITAVRDPLDALLSDFNMQCVGRTAPGTAMWNSARSEVCDYAAGSVHRYCELQYKCHFSRFPAAVFGTPVSVVGQ